MGVTGKLWLLCGLLHFRHEDGALITRMLVLDGEAPEMVFRKAD